MDKSILRLGEGHEGRGLDSSVARGMQRLGQRPRSVFLGVPSIRPLLPQLQTLSVTLHGSQVLSGQVQLVPKAIAL